MIMSTADYENLFHAHYESLTRYAFSMMKNQDEAEDVVQRLFVKIWEKRNDLDVQDSRAYLFRATYNTCLNEIKRLKRENARYSDGITEVSSSDAANHRVLESELEKQLDSAMEKLPEKCREVFRLSRFEELSYKEISDRLDISVKTVENHIAKALRIMRTELSEYLPLIVITILVSNLW